jgi:hypothetical protein
MLFYVKWFVYYTKASDNHLLFEDVIEEPLAAASPWSACFNPLAQGSGESLAKVL